MRIFFLFFVGRRWLQKGERCYWWGEGEAPRDRRNCVSRLLLPSTKPDCKLLMMTAMIILLLIMLLLEMWMVVIMKMTIENDNYGQHPR